MFGQEFGVELQGFMVWHSEARRTPSRPSHKHGNDSPQPGVRHIARTVQTRIPEPSKRSGPFPAALCIGPYGSLDPGRGNYRSLDRV